MRPPLILLLVVVAGAAGVAGGYYYGAGRASGPAAASPAPANEVPPPEVGRVAEAIDATTVRLQSGQIVRYIGVSAPSIGKTVECFGKEAMAANEGIIGKHVRLERESLLDRSQDGAWVRYVWLVEGEVDASPTPQVTSNPPSPEASAGHSESPPPAELEGVTSNPPPPFDAAQGKPTPEDPEDIFINERILDGGFGFPVVAQEMTYGERLLGAARYASSTGKGLWSRCQVETDEATGRFISPAVTECVIKGLTAGDKKLYREPACIAYGETIVRQSQGGEWFCSEEEALQAGFERAPDCPQ